MTLTMRPWLFFMISFLNGCADVLASQAKVPLQSICIRFSLCLKEE
jgi:hypothetical protein